MNRLIENGRNIFGLETSTQIYDNKRIVLSKCHKIIEYNDIYLKADAGNLIIEIWGNDLSLDDYNTEGIVIYGRISSVSFTEPLHEKNKRREDREK